MTKYKYVKNLIENDKEGFIESISEDPFLQVGVVHRMGCCKMAQAAVGEEYWDRFHNS